MSTHEENPERDAALDERELIGLLEPERPEPEEFAAKVRARVRARSDELRAAESRRAVAFEAEQAQATGLLRRAAAWLPPGVLETLAFGKLATVAAAKQAGAGAAAKGVPAAGALPFLSIGLVLVGTVLAVVSVLRPADTKRAGEPPRLLRNWMGDNRLLTVLGFAVVLGLALTGQGEALLLALIVSGAGLVLAQRALGRAGFAQRDVVGVQAAAAQFALVWGASQAWFLFQNTLHWDLPAYLAVALATAAVCLALSRAGATPGQRAGRLVGASLAAVAAVLLLVPVPGGVREQGDLVEWVRAFDPDAKTHLDWAALVDAGWALGSGAEVDRTAVRAAWVERIAAGGGSSGILEHAWSSGLLDAGEVQSVLDARGTALRLEPRHARDLGSVGPAAWLLAARGELDEADCEAAAAVLLGDDPALPERSAGFPERSLEDWVELARALEALGRGDYLAQRRDAIRAALVARWDGPRAGRRRIAGFRAFPALEGAAGWLYSPPLNPRPTADAVFLMERVGVPEEVDLEQLEGYLVRSSRPATWFHARSAGLGRYRLTAGAALEVLRARIGLPQRSLLQRLFAQRILLGLLLFGSLCVWVTWRAPVRGPDDPPLPRDFFRPGRDVDIPWLTKGRPIGARWTPGPRKRETEGER